MARNKFFKITDETFENMAYKDVFNTLEPEIQKNINIFLEDEFREMLFSLIDCETPIERLLSLYLYKQSFSYQVIKIQMELGIDVIEIASQYRIETEHKTYFVDFAIPVYDLRMRKGKIFIIECDGHDFHEKTKEQAQRDKVRERALVKQGCTVLRFTGSEIFRQPGKCASEVFDTIFNYYKQIRG